jgi:hypothetical protein
MGWNYAMRTTHTRAPARIHTHTHTRRNTYTHARTHAHANTFSLSLSLTHTHTHTHTQSHTYTHTHTHTHTIKTRTTPTLPHTDARTQNTIAIMYRRSQGCNWRPNHYPCTTRKASNTKAKLLLPYRRLSQTRDIMQNEIKFL